MKVQKGRGESPCNLCSVGA